MSREDAEQMSALACKITAVIEETGYTYGNVIRAMDAVKENYQRKGCDLLSSIRIQEVAAFGAVLD